MHVFIKKHFSQDLVIDIVSSKNHTTTTTTTTTTTISQEQDTEQNQTNNNSNSTNNNTTNENTQTPIPSSVDTFLAQKCLDFFLLSYIAFIFYG